MIHDRSVTVWQLDLESFRERVPQLARLLSPDERGRASTFLRDVHRDRFIACRAALRLVLGERLATRPEGLRFRYGPRGKPETDAADADVRFSVSHTHDRALIAVATRFDVGIDVEREAPVPDWEDLSERVFSQPERRELAEAADKSGAFLRGWTRKEAVLKALGIGISAPLAELTVSLGREAAILATLDGGTRPSDWTLIDLSAPGHVAALAARVAGASVELRTLRPAAAPARRLGPGRAC